MTELKPCPFCGSTDVHLIENDLGKSEVSITCKDCNVWVDHMFDAMSRDEAIELWNRRMKDVPMDCDEGRICPKCGKVMILCEDENTYYQIWECDGCGYKEDD